MMVKKYLRNNGGLRWWLGLFSVQLCNYAVKSGYQGFFKKNNLILFSAKYKVSR